MRQAATLVSRIPSAKFAAGRSTVVRKKARTAARLATTAGACRVLAAADDLLNALRAPATWRQGRIPRVALRRPTALLAAAEKRLLRTAGRRCAAGASRVVTQLHAGGSDLAPLPRPAEPNEQGTRRPIPTGTFRPPASTGDATSLGAGPFGRAARRGSAFAAAQPLSFFRLTDLGAQSCCGTPQEPTAAIGKGVVWYTGNTMVALSTDAGRTFRYFDPSTILPDAGLPFCCDQIVAYAPKYNVFVWLMQYWCAPGTSSPATNICLTAGTGANRIRIAVATPEDLMANSLAPGNAWSFWDMTPQDYGQPANAWFDRSSMSVNDININVQVDILRNGSSGPASLLARISLADLTGSSSQVHTWHAFDSQQRMEAVQGPGEISYFAGASDLSKDKIVSWDPYTNTLLTHEIDHSSIPNCELTATGTDGRNWYGRFGIWPGGVESATLSGTALYVAHGTGRAYCSDRVHPLFAQPAIFVATYHVGSWKKTAEKWMWHPTLALGYPAMQTDAAGDVGIAYRAAASGQNPVPVASFFTPDGESVVALPAGGPHEAGDYYSLRPGETPHSFVTTALTVVGGVKNWDFIEYGRGEAPFVAPPDVTISAPKDGANFDQGAAVTYTGLVSDPVWGAIPDASVTWTEDGTVIGHGPQVTHTESVAGPHTITLTATNGDNKTASASITINVQAPPPAPRCRRSPARPTARPSARTTRMLRATTSQSRSRPRPMTPTPRRRR